jgi:predicted dehydrogenase
MTTFRWGILGTGVMARSMTEALKARSDAVVTAVGSRTAARAHEFAQTLGIPHAHGSYEELVDAPDVDIVYVATTNDQHLANTLACIDAGKAVLCEKPLGLNDHEVGQMADAAQRRGTFLMEAMWMRFQPFLTKVEALIAAGEIGTVRHLHADFCIPLPYAPDNRWFDPKQGGGSLLDLGVYPLTLAYHVLGEPRATVAMAQLAPTGVDAQIGVQSTHDSETLSVLTSSLVADGAWEATISGTTGRIRLHPPFHHSPRVTLHRRGELIASHDTSYGVSGLQFEIDEVHSCLRRGATESDRMPLDDSAAIAAWMTEVRRQCAIRYPGE